MSYYLNYLKHLSKLNLFIKDILISLNAGNVQYSYPITCPTESTILFVPTGKILAW